jgi:exonuclease III
MTDMTSSTRLIRTRVATQDDLWARRAYSQPFSVIVTQEQLEQLQTREYRTHSSLVASALHAVGDTFCLGPVRLFWHAKERCKTPLPGTDQAQACKGRSIKAVSGVGALALAVPGVVSTLVGVPVRALEHRWRPLFQFMNLAPAGYKPPTIHLTQERPFDVWTANLGLVPSSVCYMNDVRGSEERASELARAILAARQPPTMICAQELWNEDAAKAFITGLGDRYPFMIHNVAPQIVGMNASVAIFSQHPISEVAFEKFEDMVFPHSLPPRGILRVRVETEKGPLYVYNLHTQSMREDKHSEARLKQLGQLRAMMRRDKERDAGAIQVVMGDFNITDLNEDGQRCGAKADETLAYFHEHFDDLFLNDHDRSGKRTSGEPQFLNDDNAVMGLEGLPEPRASWYNGPMQTTAELRAGWGTDGWFGRQEADRARYDRIATLAQSAGPHLIGRVESRRWTMVPAGGTRPVSGCSDHLIVHGRLWLDGSSAESKGDGKGDAKTEEKKGS